MCSTNAGLLANIIANHYYTLMEIFMNASDYLFDDQPISSAVFLSIELGILGQRVACPLVGSV